MTSGFGPLWEPRRTRSKRECVNGRVQLCSWVLADPACSPDGRGEATWLPDLVHHCCTLRVEPVTIEPGKIEVSPIKDWQTYPTTFHPATYGWWVFAAHVCGKLGDHQPLWVNPSMNVDWIIACKNHGPFTLFPLRHIGCFTHLSIHTYIIIYILRDCLGYFFWQNGWNHHKSSIAINDKTIF